MAVSSRRKAPALRVHTPSSQAYVFVGGKRLYLGRHDLPATVQKYHQVVAELLASGGQHPVEKESIRVKELIARFWIWAQGYYVKGDGRPTQELDNIRQALRPLKALYADTPVTSFGPRALMAVRQKMVELGWCRGSINKNIGRIKTMIRWGTEQELIPGGIYNAIQAVSGLKRGRSGARSRSGPPSAPRPGVRDPALRQPADLGACAASTLTAARAGELVGIRKGDIDRSGKVWVYTPAEHKTAHHGHKRVIYIGPKAQESIQPFLLRPNDAPLFSPAEAERERRKELHAARKTPAGCGNGPGTNRTPTPRRFAGDRYDVGSYRRAIARACEVAFAMPAEIQASDGDRPAKDDSPEQLAAKAARFKQKSMQRRRWREMHCWHPHQLRHTAATLLRREFGLEAARVVLGHRSAAETELYAERDAAKVWEVIQKTG